MIPYGKQDINQADIDSVIDVIQSDFLTQGPQVPLFEKTVSDYCGAEYGVAVNSATSALHIACLALGLGKGDWLWTSPNSFVASANCGLYCGAKVDFVDIKVLANFNKVISTGENKWSCLDPFRRISIMANGDVIPCCSFHGKNLVLGNVKNRSIKELWKSSEIRDVRKNLIENKEHVCKLCQELS